MGNSARLSSSSGALSGRVLVPRERANLLNTVSALLDESWTDSMWVISDLQNAPFECCATGSASFSASPLSWSAKANVRDPICKRPGPLAPVDGGFAAVSFCRAISDVGLVSGTGFVPAFTLLQRSRTVELSGSSTQMTKKPWLITYWSQNKHLQVEFRVDIGQPADPAPFNAGKIVRTRMRNNQHKATVPLMIGTLGSFGFAPSSFSQVQKTHGHHLVILLDQPALSLHAKAQTDLLRYTPRGRK
jgi:hypothetical protein